MFLVAPRTVVMKVVTCDTCRVRFAIGHGPGSQDSDLAGRQAAWLVKELVWDHIREAKHRGSVSLPGAAEMDIPISK